MTFFADKNILVIATKQEVAKNLVLKVKVMYENLPSWLKLSALEDNKLSLRLNNGSQIKATSSSGDTGRSEALSLLIIDECCEYDTTITVKNKHTDIAETISIGDLYKRLENF
jgi:phage terminase large subunit-like protein